MSNIRSLAVMPDHIETNFERISRVLSRGFMVGAAILISAITRYENRFYGFLVFSIYMAATLAHIVLNWKAVKRYFFFFAMVTIILPVFVMLPSSENLVSLLLDRLPILVALMSLCIEEFSRLLSLMPDPRLVPPDVVPEPDDDSVIPLLGRDNGLFAHMDGGEREHYNTPSQVSSDISLSNVGPGKLPSSCDTMTRTFWPDELDRTHERGGDVGHKNGG